MSTPPPFLPLPRMSVATLLRALFKRPSRRDALPCTTRYRLAHLDAVQLARYREALGFAGPHVPLTYYYLLAQRAHLATMLGAAFPFRLAGAIHVDNAMESGATPALARPLALVTEVEVGAPAANGALHAALVTRATQDGTWVFTCRSTYLMVRGRPGQGSRTAAPRLPQAPIAAWPLTAASGRAYAALSGDWNPIHLWPWSARLAGLDAPIIHGMHTLARACAELERASGREMARLDGRFRAPIALGSEAALAADLAGGRYTVEAAGRVAVEGGFAFV